MNTGSADVMYLEHYLQRQRPDYEENNVNVMAESALIEDAVMFFAKVLKSSNHYLGKVLFCQGTDTWEHGQTVFNLMKTVRSHY